MQVSTVGGVINLAIRRLRRLTGRTFDVTWPWRWVLTATLLAGLGLVDLVVDVPAWITVIAVGVSLALLVIDVRDVLDPSNQLRFEPWSDDFRDVEAVVENRPRFSMYRYPQPGGVVVVDDVASLQLAQGDVLIERAPSAYRLPTWLSAVSRAYVGERIRGRTDVWNAELVGLSTNLGSGDGGPPERWTLMTGRYYDHLGSDLLATVDVRRGSYAVPGFGRSLVIDRQGRLRDFEDSWLLNALGSQVLAITSDFRWVAVMQSAKNETSANQFAPTGSGSLEPGDTSGLEDLGEALLGGAVREMSEESGVQESDIESIKILGFGRWLGKGGKPEAFSVARLRIDSHEVAARRAHRLDRPFSTRNELLRMNRSATSWDPRQPYSMLEERPRGILSVPLSASLTLCAWAMSDQRHPARDLLKDCLSE